MEGTNRRRAALVGGVVVMIAISAWAQDWPQWRGPNRDGKVTGFTAILDAGSCLLALPSNSELIVFEPSSEQYTELAKIKVADTLTYAHPVVAGNRVYVKDQETLIMWTIQ